MTSRSRSGRTGFTRRSLPQTDGGRMTAFTLAPRWTQLLDGGRCAYISADGQRYRETSCLELHHREPHAHGGPASAENLALYCGARDALAANETSAASTWTAVRGATPKPRMNEHTGCSVPPDPPHSAPARTPRAQRRSSTNGSRRNRRGTTGRRAAGPGVAQDWRTRAAARRPTQPHE